jgi:pilus assembly protein CpaF
MAIDDRKIPTGPNQDWKSEAGPIRQFLNDPNVTEIMVNRFDRIFVEINGELHELERGFESADALMRFVQVAAVFAGREVNRKTPCVDTRLPDGSRLSMIVPPVALDGPIVTIRKHSKKTITHREMTSRGTVDDKLVVFLYQLVRCRQNLIICGGTGSGKTTLLNMISGFVPSTERIITIEDTAELQLNVNNLVRMESKPATSQDPGVSLRELLTNSLRMRPDRIIIGECRGPEAWDMLIAMNTGHEGSMTTLHSNSAYDALRRLEAMIIRSGQEVPLSMIKSDIASTIQFIVHMDRQADGKRRVVEVLELVGRDDESYHVKKIFEWTEAGGFLSCGNVPTFVGRSDDPNMQLKPEFFAPGYKYKPAA